MSACMRSGAAALGACALVLNVANTACAQNASDLPAQDRPILLDMRDLHAIGGMDAEPWAQFGSVAQVAFDGRGLLYILDRVAQRVVVIDENGRLVRTLGREGRGPGEFIAPGSMAVFDDGSVIVYDLIRRTFSAFDSAGALRFDVRVPLDHGAPDAIFPLPDGRLVANAIVFRVDGAPHFRTSRGMTPTSRGRVLVFSADARTPGTIADTYTPGQAPVVGGAPVRIAFQPAFSMAVSRDGRIVFADSTTYTLHLLHTAGPQTLIRRPLQPRRVTEEDRRNERERQLALLDAPDARAMGASLGGSVDRRAALEREREQLRQMRFASEIPVIAGVAVDWAGRIWVQRTGRRVGEPGPIDVIAPAAEYIGTVTSGFGLPAAFGPDGRVAFIDTDELGVQRIRVARVRSPALRD